MNNTSPANSSSMLLLPDQLVREVTEKHSIEDIVSIVQGQFLHCDNLALYNVEGQLQSRTTLPLLERLKGLTSFTPKNPEERIIVTCRDFALLTCSLLRCAGFESRVRCGFASYFIPGQYEDHWITEHKSAGISDWIRIDSQLDEGQQDHYQFRSPLCLSSTDFMTASEAVLSLQNKTRQAFDFGQGEARGEWFLKVNLIRDFLSIKEIYSSNWDRWREAAQSMDVGALRLGPDWIVVAEKINNFSSPADIQAIEAEFQPLLSPFWIRNT